ncbi:MAG TPA: hypothetical protein VEY67_00330 [Candidatus Dormibacteraeota bacterium]|nr:hypothetical protein [Candidatus Dormibacteraeota bacterium]
MPEGPLVLLSVALGFALAAAALLTLRRSGTVAAASRELTASRRALREFSARADADIGPILARIDGVRRRILEPAAISDELRAARSRIDERIEEGRALAVVPSHQSARAAIRGELERAARALDMVEYGSSILGQARGRGRELEAQTAIKRGYLNLLHAREAISRHAAEAGTRAGDARRDFGRAAD